MPGEQGQNNSLQRESKAIFRSVDRFHGGPFFVGDEQGRREPSDDRGRVGMMNSPFHQGGFSSKDGLGAGRRAGFAVGVPHVVPPAGNKDEFAGNKNAFGGGISHFFDESSGPPCMFLGGFGGKGGFGGTKNGSVGSKGAMPGEQGQNNSLQRESNYRTLTAARPFFVGDEQGRREPSDDRRRGSMVVNTPFHQGGLSSRRTTASPSSTAASTPRRAPWETPPTPARTKQSTADPVPGQQPFNSLAAVLTEKTLPTVTAEELAKHNTEEDCWIAVQ